MIPKKNINNTDIIQKKNNSYQKRQNTKKIKKSHTLEEMIEHLKMRRNQDREKVVLFTNEKKSNFEYHYWQNTIMADLVIDQVIEERDYMLKTIKTLITNNFLKNPKGND